MPCFIPSQRISLEIGEGDATPVIVGVLVGRERGAEGQEGRIGRIAMAVELPCSKIGSPGPVLHGALTQVTQSV